MATKATAPEKREFKAELKQLLHLITHSLYSNPEIFLRELISNASDAINKIKFDSLQHEELLEDNKDWKIKLTADKDAGTLTVSDNGVGMSRESVVENLGTIAHSGTRAFLESLRAANATSRPDLIGQFGVGFYSAFMVADKVVVHTRPAGSPADGVRWESDGQGEYTVEPAAKASRGTDVTLHLKPDAKEFLEPWALRRVVKKFSDFLEHPVVMDVEREEGEGGDKKTVTAEETLNARKAIWLRGKAEVTAEEHAEFYKQTFHDAEPPAKVIHYAVEGAQEFRVLLYVPKRRPFEMEFGDFKAGPRLYVQRVLIMDHCEELLPPHLRFVRGVVDSSDLPLNVSREILQQNPLVEKIRANVTKSVMAALEDMKKDDSDNYVTFFQELGAILKEGVHRDYANRAKLAELFLFESLNTEPGKYITLEQYHKAMPVEQKEIYYLIGEMRAALANSPYVEAARKQGRDVLLLTEPVDELMMPAMPEYRGCRFKAADRGELAAGGDQPDAARYAKLFEFLKGRLPEVGDIRLSSRLTDSAACLVAEEHGMSAHLERLLHRMGRGDPAGAQKRVLELNGEHPAVAAVRDLYDKSPEDPRVAEYARLFFDQAVLAEGSKLKDPAGFARRVNDLLVKDAGRV